MDDIHSGDYTDSDFIDDTDDNFDCDVGFSKSPKTSTDLSKFAWILVSLSNLLQLFNFCLDCGSRLLCKTYAISGFTITINYICSGIMSHHGTWHSSDFYHRFSLANVQIPSAFALNGLGYADITSFCKTLNLPCISKAQYYRNVKKFLYPQICRRFSSMRKSLIEQIKGKVLILAGDGQFDSPGHCAKYCTYSILDTATGKLVDFFVIQKGQYQGELEKQACQEVMHKLVNNVKLNIGKFVTDRHPGIGKMMRETYPNIEHGYDIWHVARSIKKKLVKLGKVHEPIKLWTKSIVNHFWFCCQRCKGDPDLLIQMFHSFMLHVSNHHSWASARTLNKFRKFLDPKKPYPKPFTCIKGCIHPRLKRNKVRATQWLKVDSPEFEALVKMLTNTRLCNDMKKCRSFLHTGELENIHSVKNKYLPKRKHFGIETSIVYMMLVAIETNVHAAARESGKLKNKSYVEYSKAAADYVLKKKYLKDSIPFKLELMADIHKNLEDGNVEKLDLSEYILKAVPKFIHSSDIVKPSKEELVKRYTRFKTVNNQPDTSGEK